MRYYSLTDKGLVRKTNQDAVGVFHNQSDDALFIVCDGVGGNNAGDIASSLSVNKIGKQFLKIKGFKSLTDARKQLNKIITIVNSEVYLESMKDEKYAGMATTLAGLLFTDKGVLLMNIGDSRTYSFKNGKLIQQSVDDSYVNELLKANLITEREALNHPKKNMITKAIGTSDYIETTIKLINDKADYFLICSDGLHDYVKESVIVKILSSDLEIEAKTKELLNAALSAGGPDNISIILIEGDFNE